MIAGVQRALLILAAIAGPTAVISFLLAVAVGGSPARAVGTGFYVVGVSLMVVGILSGVRGPVRAQPTSDTAGASLLGIAFGPRRLRKATEDERRDSVSAAGLFLALGFVLVVLGVVVDSDVELL